MLRRGVQHIPEKHFRMIRYFGFLANRVCGQYLPKVYEALKMATPGPVASRCLKAQRDTPAQ
ncbi:hypothetical protein ALQ95_200078 [Pseudomonas syringae pv. ribicola]|uniref:Transposase IS801/IS1294 domain-containing protein n=1 Tax=Pseudomonas syringae pv. ribicola TaxID=55398 RepID=A0A3M2VQF7_PSESI|nr:hypothetical protein ALQ95_200078 [Pseudomonas syringae pv. ribicola]